MAASGTDEASSEFASASDGEDVMLIPEEVMQQARLAMEDTDHHEIIGLRQDGRGFVVKANATALKRLSSQADEIEPYWAVSCLGSTGAGKSFFIAKLLQALGHTGSAPYSIDFSVSLRLVISQFPSPATSFATLLVPSCCLMWRALMVLCP